MGRRAFSLVAVALVATTVRGDVAVKASFDATLVRPETLVGFQVAIVQELDLDSEEGMASMLTMDTWEDIWAGVPQFENAAWVCGPVMDVARSWSDEGDRRMRRRRSTLRWTVKPRGAGPLTASGVALRIGKTQVTTEPAATSVAVGAPAALGNARFEVRMLGLVDRTRPFAGEGVTLAYWLLCNGNVREVVSASSGDFAGFRMESIPVPVPPPEQELIHEGRLFRATLHSVSALYPLAPGHVAVPSRTFVIHTEDGGRWAMPLELEASSDEIQLEVLPLPLERRPADFTGAVGMFELGTSLRSGSDATASLTVTVSGRGDLRSLPPPVLPALPWLQLWGPRIEDRVTLDGDAPASLKTFTWELRPSRAGLLQLDDIRIPYFDPLLGRYEVARAPAVRGQLAAVHDAPVLSAPHLATLRPLKGRPRPAAASWVLPAALLLGTNLLLGARRLLGPGRLRARRTSAVVRARAILAEAVAATSPHREDLVSRAVVGFIAERRGRGALTAKDAVAELVAAGVREPLPAEVRELLEDCDGARFSGSPRVGDGEAGAREPGERARALLGRLDAALPRRARRA